MASPVITLKNLDGFIAQLAKIKDAARSGYARDAVEAGLRVIETEAAININEKFSGDSKGEMAKNRTVEVTNSSDKVTGTLTFHSNHARIHEFGGRINPIKGQFLAIPVTDGARKLQSPATYPDKLHFVGDAQGGVLMDSSNTVVFALKRSVEMPPRPFLRPAIDQNKDKIQQAMAGVLVRAIKENASGN